ncbi:hypothetical protein J2X50_004682 [Aminobacter sp. BE322]
MKSIVPPTGNQLICMIEATSLVGVIAMADLLYSVQSIYNRIFEIIPMLMVAVLWNLFITSILDVGQGAPRPKTASRYSCASRPWAFEECYRSPAKCQTTTWRKIKARVAKPCGLLGGSEARRMRRDGRPADQSGHMPCGRGDTAGGKACRRGLS